MESYRKNLVCRVRNQKNTTLNYDEFRPKLSKAIIDEIDHVLAKHYSFTNEELDFIVNYDIKYCMGKDADDGDE